MKKQKNAESLKATGKVQIQRFNAEGVLVEERNVPNLVVTAGKNYIAAKMVATTNSPVSMNYMAIGTGTGTPAAENTTLGAEVGRVSLNGQVDGSNLNRIIYSATFPAGTGTGAITEAAVLNAITSGTMLCRTTFPVVNKGANDSVAITWYVTVS